MINFVVVEDNKFHRENIKEVIMGYMMKNYIDFNIHVFEDNTTDLKKLINNKNIFNKIYLLDFELPSCNAVEVSREIRESDWVSPIIIFTAHFGMALSSFKQRLQILDFLSKQFALEKNIYELLDLCVNRIITNKALCFKYKSVSTTVPFDNILYIYRDSFERKIVIITSDGEEYRFLSSISKLLKALPEGFKLCNKGTILNTKRVKSYCWRTFKVTFDNECEKYLLSRKHRKELDKVVAK